MYTQYYEDYLKKCSEKLKATTSSRIQNQLKKLKQNFKDENFDRVLAPFVTILAKDIVPHLDEEDIEDAIEFELEDYSKAVNYARKSFVMKVTLKGQEKNIYRLIEIPATITLAQLCYIVLTVFQSEGSHLFSIEVGKQTYYSEGFEDVDFFASDHVLPEFSLRKGSHMLFTYDLGDNYEFDIVVEETKSYHHFVTLECVQVIDGKGYGIWEDAHYELDLFYDDREKFDSFVKENGYNLDWYPIDMEFNKEDMNKELIDGLYFFMAVYENPELLENDDDEEV